MTESRPSKYERLVAAVAAPVADYRRKSAPVAA